jgi:hypothetical protein
VRVEDLRFTIRMKGFRVYLWHLGPLDRFRGYVPCGDVPLCQGTVARSQRTNWPIASGVYAHWSTASGTHIDWSTASGAHAYWYGASGAHVDWSTASGDHAHWYGDSGARIDWSGASGVHAHWSGTSGGARRLVRRFRGARLMVHRERALISL